mmetsp:Transcript_59398/g.173783  ORF Transcript_59398/g.173783 Transcript_59398/m.173783 type:complete len:728 (-) Transcript_59398:75-2258(-)
MKVTALSAIFVILALAVCPSDATLNVQTPISRVVKLLKGLSMKTEMEGKAEEKLYEKFVCWAQKVIDTKTASNAAGESRKESLEAYIADIQAGRVEFTSERTDLEKEISGLNQDIDTAEALRAQEHEQFLAAEEEMLQALTALNKALTLLGDVTGRYSTGTLLAQRSSTQLSEGFAARVQDATDLEFAAKLGSRMLSAGDAVFLRRLLTGDVPTPDWKKLNRQATFKMSYKARSDKIMATLTQMNNTFTKNLEEARSREAEALGLFNTLMTSKNTLKSEQQEALQRMTAETGARSLSLSEAQDEVGALTQQISNDNTFIQQTKAELAQKKQEWKTRSALRTAEIAAFSKAIEILYNDDARDLMKKSYASQGYSLVQEHEQVSRGKAAGRLEMAVDLLRKTAKAGSDKRLTLFASRISLGNRGQFTTVIGAIDAMVQTLKDEENTDLTNKELCEADRANDTRLAAKTSREMDEATDSITKLRSEIADIEADIEEKNQAIAATQAELDEATTLREAEHAEWQASDRDDQEMATIVQEAKDVLEQFYQDNQLMLLQQPQAGQAPPPPPSTWEGSYGGKTQQATGVIATLDIIKTDIEKDIQAASTAENASATKYNTFSDECNNQMQDLRGAISTLNGTKGEKEQDVSQLTADRLNKKDSLGAVMTQISDANRGCEYITVNYPIRLRNRQMEIDGLLKAKAVLAGAQFSEGPDPSRELTPGDALFLQRRWK